MALPRSPEEKKASLLHEVAMQVRKKCTPTQVDTIEAFIRYYYRQIGPEDLLERGSSDLYGAALAHFNLAQRRQPGERLVRVYNPRVEEHGWHSTHTIVEVLQEDTPFLVDSARMELNRQGLTVHLIIHPVMAIQRDDKGRFMAVLPPGEAATGAQLEAVMHFEVDRQSDPAMLGALRDGVHRVLDDVRAAVEDWPEMRTRLRQAAEEMVVKPPPVSEAECKEAVTFLRWLDRDSFTFLGYRTYELEREGREVRLRAAADSGLGIARTPSEGRLSESFARLPPELRELAYTPKPLILTKGSARATVHRPGYLDYIGIRRFDRQGRVIGEHRFLGRYTSVAYTSRPTKIPLLRRKVERVMEASGLHPGSHSAKALLNILETLPRDELFQSGTRELQQTANAILQLQERQRVRLLVRHDPYHRFLSCLVYLPRERFHTDVRLRVQEILGEAFEATDQEFAVAISESVLARVYLTLYTGPGQLPEYDVREIEARIVAATRSWSDALHHALLREFGEEEGNRTHARYGHAFPASYREDYTPAVAVPDIRQMESVAAEGVGILLYRPLEAPSGRLRIKLFRRGVPISLSKILPMLENMGVSVTDERPHEVRPTPGTAVWVHDLGMAFESDEELDADEVRERFRDAFARVWEGRVEDDGFNRLILHARCTWREAEVVRAYCKYLLQTRFPFSQRYMEQVLVSQPQIARMLVDLFCTRFDPSRRDTSAERCERLSDAILHSLERVPILDEDRILRRFHLLIQATLRTNCYQWPNRAQKTYIAYKLDPTRLPDLPEPRPRYEVFVYSPRMEGVHLRGGKVSRGGIRWSDRREDFRSEIFGLMKAQMVKNAVIVPVGAKGGFIVKHLPADRAARYEEVVACYRTFIRGLLDLTDNLEGDRVVPPTDTVRHDGDDPYLVVAADKGTATFSDLANEVAAEYGYWLGDAFASGGSAGYDHKKLGITARGAWESVTRHFREIGVDIGSQNFTVAGIGSMSGDVFGNGMLLSRHLRLVAAFSRGHIFLDPDPDPVASFHERERLFRIGGSWVDYDPHCLSEGGGTFSRGAKSIPLSPAVRGRLGVEAEALTPNELIQAILRAPVDLLWNGGVGTFVKAGSEENEAVGDRSNDPVRIDAGQLRCRVIAEGGNLGLTQRARVEYALMGGRINTDFIDNSGGVDCSDREVNLKVLLHQPVREGRIGETERNALLAESAEVVAALVRQDNNQQAEALSMAERHAAELLTEHVTMMRSLEKADYLDRRTWLLPNDEAVASRQAAGKGLTRPELAVLLAYSKIALFDTLLESGIGGDPAFAEELREYFPPPVVERFGPELAQHRLRPELVATLIANSLINRMGITAVHRIEALSGSPSPEIARAFVAARRIFDLPSLWQTVATLNGRIDSVHQLDLLEDIRSLAHSGTLWLLRNRPRPLPVAATVEAFQTGIKALAHDLPTLLDPDECRFLAHREARHRSAGIPEDIARDMAAVPLLFSTLDIVEAAARLERPAPPVARHYFALGAALGINWLRDRIGALPTTGHWSRLAREAMLDELYRLHRQLTVTAIRSAPATEEAHRPVAAWAEAHAAAVEHYQRRTEQFRTASRTDLALLSVALNELRHLTRGMGEAGAGDTG